LDNPAANLAQRLLSTRGLDPPIDIEALVRDYADVIFKPIPIGAVDGVSLNLKLRGKKARVIVNSFNPPRRIRFTLAHELGHILIPWHVGSIVDAIDLSASFGSNYGALEQEANTFAAELLMPKAWVLNLVHDTENLAATQKEIIKGCETSPLSAAIRLIELLPPDVVYASERDGRVEYSGKSEGTLAPTLSRESAFSESAYDYATQHYRDRFEGRTLHWWRLPANVSFTSLDPRPWREILRDILSDVAPGLEASRKMQQSINGIAANAHSAARQRASYSPETIGAACLQRFRDRAEYKEFVNHRLFNAFIHQRAKAFFVPTEVGVNRGR
jgi:IrrE N-terminal-like domain